jgi:hypothetical protein
MVQIADIRDNTLDIYLNLDGVSGCFRSASGNEMTICAIYSIQMLPVCRNRPETRN